MEAMEDDDNSDGEIASKHELRLGCSLYMDSTDGFRIQHIDQSSEMASSMRSELETISLAHRIAISTKLGSHLVSEPVNSPGLLQLGLGAERFDKWHTWQSGPCKDRLSWDHPPDQGVSELTYDDSSRYENRGDGEVKKIGHGESYRPSTRARSPDSRFGRDRSRSPPRRERARTPPRERGRTPVTDTYQPGARNRSPRRRSRSPVRRSRSPPYRARDRTPVREVPNWRSRERARTPPRNRTPPRAKSPPRARTPARVRSPTRARSPMRTRSPVKTRTPPRARSPRARTPPRRYSPRRGDDRRERQRSPRRDEQDGRDSRRRSRSPYDSRAPQRVRSPPPPRRSPPRGPRGSWRSRSRSPPRRDDRVQSGPTSLTWRRRSPSPAPVVDRSSGRTSASNSHVSSPPVHPSRLAIMQPTYDDRTSANSPVTFERSPLPFREFPGSSRERSPVLANKIEEPLSPKLRSPPRGPAALRTLTKPSTARNFTAPVTSPTASNSSGPGSAPMQNKPDNTNTAVPPLGPRGYNIVSRGSAHQRGGRGGSFSDRRPEPGPTWGGAPPTPTIPITSPTVPSPSSTSSSIPTGPRAASASSSDWFSKTWSAATPRPSAHSIPNATSHQRPQQPRVHPAIANLPQIIPGGRKDPSYSGIPKDLDARIRKNDEEIERLREDLRVKQEKLRSGLRTWDKLERESKSMGLKAELSERHVRILAGEGVGGAAF